MPLTEPWAVFDVSPPHVRINLQRRPDWPLCIGGRPSYWLDAALDDAVHRAAATGFPHEIVDIDGRAIAWTLPP